MALTSRLELAPSHRPGATLGGGVGVTERWAWDFVVDGRPLSEAIEGDVIGALGWGDSAWQAAVTEKLLGRAAPDMPPDRVALYVCPECGDLGCGAVTASVRREGHVVVWQDFRWERDWEETPGNGRPVPLGPFHFDRGAYGRLLRVAAPVRPGPDVHPVAAS